MAEVTLASSSQRQVWVTNYFKEYVRRSGFMPYMKAGNSAIIQVRRDLQNEAGKTINIPLITRLKGSGVSGSQMLIGHEDDLGNYNAQIIVDWIRNGVVIPKSTSYLTEIDLWGAARAQLVQWSGEKLRDDIIAALGSIIVPGSAGGADTVVAYSAATSGQRNTFLANNADRVLFGVSRANNSGNVWATSLGNVDSTNDKLSTTIGSLAKRMARTADPHITPFMTEDGREYFVMFCNPFAFRDLKNDQNMISANRDARAREGSGMDRNPIFQDGDLIYDGVIYREIPELTQLTITGAGNGGIDVAQNFLCGQGSVGIGYGQDPRVITDKTYDYEFRPRIGIEELRGVRKMSFNGVQYGVVTVLTAGVSDS